MKPLDRAFQIIEQGGKTNDQIHEVDVVAGDVVVVFHLVRGREIDIKRFFRVKASSSSSYTDNSHEHDDDCLWHSMHG